MKSNETWKLSAIYLMTTASRTSYTVKTHFLKEMETVWQARRKSKVVPLSHSFHSESEANINFFLEWRQWSSYFAECTYYKQYCIHTQMHKYYINIFSKMVISTEKKEKWHVPSLRKKEIMHFLSYAYILPFYYRFHFLPFSWLQCGKSRASRWWWRQHWMKIINSYKKQVRT